MAERNPETDHDPESTIGLAAAPGAWDELVRRFGAPLQRMAAEALGRVGQRPERHRVEDLVQDVYIRLLAGGRGFDPHRRRGPQVLAYLRRVVRSAAIDGVRAAGAAKRRAGDWLPSAAADLIDPGPDPEQRLLARDRRRRLLARCRAAAGRGPGAARDTRLLALTVLGGWTSREIAAASGGRLRASTVDASVCRMRRRLAASGVRLPRRSGGPRRRSSRSR